MCVRACPFTSAWSGMTFTSAWSGMTFISAWSGMTFTSAWSGMTFTSAWSGMTALFCVFASCSSPYTGTCCKICLNRDQSAADTSQCFGLFNNLRLHATSLKVCGHYISRGIMALHTGVGCIGKSNKVITKGDHYVWLLRIGLIRI